jgi:hypothetical protein
MKARKILFLSHVVSLEHEVPALLPPQIKDRSKFLTEYINLVLCDSKFLTEYIILVLCDDGKNPIHLLLGKGASQLSMDWLIDLG